MATVKTAPVSGLPGVIQTIENPGLIVPLKVHLVVDLRQEPISRLDDVVFLLSPFGQ
jgi:hypothetical protein